MMAVTPFIRLRLLQLWRIGSGLGVFYVILILSVFTIALLSLQGFISKGGNAEVLVAGWIIVLSTIHFSRRDHHFFRIVQIPSWKICSVEYSLLSIPVLAISIIYGPTWLPGIIFLSGIGISFFRPFHGFANSGKAIFSGLPIPFEFLSGMRIQFLGTALLLAGAVLAAVIPFGIILFDFFFLAFVAGIYQAFESRLILEGPQIGPRKFLIKKWKGMTRTYFLFLAPFHFVAVMINPFSWALVLLVFFYGLVLSSYFLFTKYAFYEPNERMGAQNITSSLVLMSLLLPFLAPLPFILVIRNFSKAINNLNFYLNDFD